MGRPKKGTAAHGPNKNIYNAKYNVTRRVSVLLEKLKRVTGRESLFIFKNKPGEFQYFSTSGDPLRLIEEFKAGKIRPIADESVEETTVSKMSAGFIPHESSTNNSESSTNEFSNEGERDKELRLKRNLTKSIERKICSLTKTAEDLSELGVDVGLLINYEKQTQRCSRQKFQYHCTRGDGELEEMMSEFIATPNSLKKPVNMDSVEKHAEWNMQRSMLKRMEESGEKSSNENYVRVGLPVGAEECAVDIVVPEEAEDMLQKLSSKSANIGSL